MLDTSIAFSLAHIRGATMPWRGVEGFHEAVYWKRPHSITGVRPYYFANCQIRCLCYRLIQSYAAWHRHDTERAGLKGGSCAENRQLWWCLIVNDKRDTPPYIPFKSICYNSSVASTETLAGNLIWNSLEYMVRSGESQRLVWEWWFGLRSNGCINLFERT